ncbi:MAG: alpha/beta hydrolase [Acidobacteriaceae bacterium]
MSPLNSVPNTAEALHTQLLHLKLDGKQTEVAYHSLPSAHGTILLLHEALGSVAYWKHFPHHLAHATGYNVIAYSRAGHGNSEGPLAERTDAYYLRQVNDVIPTLLNHFAVANPVLYGHSEGAGIAMLYTAQNSTVRALILESPFVVSTNAAGDLIHKMAAAYPGSKLQERLAHYHQHPDDVFNAWTSWAATLGNEVFAYRDFLPRIACPVLALQGARDEFGIALQLAALQETIPHLEHEIYPDTGHLPHREQTDRVLQRVSQFLSPTHLFNPLPSTSGSRL